MDYSSLHNIQKVLVEHIKLIPTGKSPLDELGLKVKDQNDMA